MKSPDIHTRSPTSNKELCIAYYTKIFPPSLQSRFYPLIVANCERIHRTKEPKKKPDSALVDLVNWIT